MICSSDTYRGSSAEQTPFMRYVKSAYPTQSNPYDGEHSQSASHLLAIKGADRSIAVNGKTGVNNVLGVAARARAIRSLSKHKPQQLSMDVRQNKRRDDMACQSGEGLRRPGVRSLFGRTAGLLLVVCI